MKEPCVEILSQRPAGQEWTVHKTNITDSDGRPYCDLKCGDTIVACGPENTIKAVADTHNAIFKFHNG